ncbi:MAG TPA: ABC transporter permease subunit [Casimicrobiaceae bacterium]|nr:ABC transporter permease subunit [Casimicrobiaceae bacterium]
MASIDNGIASTVDISATASPRLSPRVRAWLLGLAGTAVAIAVWSLLSHWLAHGGGVINRLPGPIAVVRELVQYATSDLASDLLASLRVFAIGWLVGAASAALVGLALGRASLLGGIFLPIVEAIRPVSSIAWVPLSIVWFGFGLTSKVFLVGLAVFLVVIVYAVDGSHRVPADLERTATMLGMNEWQRFASLVLPGTLAEVLIGSRVALTAGWGTVIVAELVAANSGLGAHLIAVEQSYNVSAVMATMICFAAAGFAMNAAFTFMEQRLMPWRHDRARQER